MENTSEKVKPIKPIPQRERSFFRRRFQNRIHAAVAALFAEEAEAGRITKKALAELLGKDPAQITRWLSDPSNIESDTISDILLGMKAEMEPRIVRFADAGKGNFVHPLIRQIERSEETVELAKSQRPAKPYQELGRSSSNTKVVVLEPAKS